MGNTPHYVEYMTKANFERLSFTNKTSTDIKASHDIDGTSLVE